MNDKLLRQILGEDLTPEQEKSRVQEFLTLNPGAAATLLDVCLSQKQYYKRAYAEAKQAREDALSQNRRYPWHPAKFLRYLDHDQQQPTALVVAGNRRLAVAVDPQLNGDRPQFGQNVFLSADLSAIVGKTAGLNGGGTVGTFRRFHNDHAILHSATNEELLVEIPEELREQLEQGDLLLYSHESLVAWDRVAKDPAQLKSLLYEVPDVSFSDIGGLDEVIEEILVELSLYFLHREIVEQHQLKPWRGITMIGPPGVGKTMIAKALARELSQQNDIKVKFFNIQPGIHRSIWYGQTEENVRAMFAMFRKEAQSEDCFVVAFFDDADQLGARDSNMAMSVDTRVIPSFLEAIDGMESLDRVLLIGATNRPDLMDVGLIRPGRFGDQIFRIPRPNREAAAQVLRKYLAADLPFAVEGSEGRDAAEVLVEKALAHIYSPNGEGSRLATLTFRDGSRKPLSAKDLMSGALLANAVQRAKKPSCRRALGGARPGITAGDLLATIDQQLHAIAGTLKPGPALTQMLGLPTDLDVVKVEVHSPADAIRNYDYFAN
jgi:proteasome-associated ATPase